MAIYDDYNYTNNISLFNGKEERWWRKRKRRGVEAWEGRRRGRVDGKEKRWKKEEDGKEGIGRKERMCRT